MVLIYGIGSILDTKQINKKKMHGLYGKCSQKNRQNHRKNIYSDYIYSNPINLKHVYILMAIPCHAYLFYYEFALESNVLSHFDFNNKHFF